MEAGHVYLLMENEYRISRNSRASWYFKHLNSVIDTNDESQVGVNVNSFAAVVQRDHLKTTCPCNCSSPEPHKSVGQLKQLVTLKNAGKFISVKVTNCVTDHDLMLLVS